MTLVALLSRYRVEMPEKYCNIFFNTEEITIVAMSNIKITVSDISKEYEILAIRILKTGRFFTNPKSPSVMPFARGNKRPMLNPSKDAEAIDNIVGNKK
jgi:hypothetical protein